MASIKNLYEQELGEIFAYGQLTDKTPNSNSDYANEVLAVQWIEDLEKEAAEALAKQKEKKLKREDDTMETRKMEAEFATNIKREDARRDLFLNQKSPYLFRKYMLEYWNRLTNEYLESYPTLSDYQRRTINNACANEVVRIVHQCGYCCVPDDQFDPHDEWIFEIPYDERPKGKNGTTLGVDTRYWVKSRFGGPCSSWPGHAGYCWNGTYHDDRNFVTGLGTRNPFKTMIPE